MKRRFVEDDVLAMQHLARPIRGVKGFSPLMKKVYICSPYKGRGSMDRILNIKRAEEYSKEVYEKGYLPICVHIYLEKATGLDEDKGEREKLLMLGKEMLNGCNEIWVFGDYISEGMREEINYAKECGIKVVYISNLRGKEDGKSNENR